MAMYTELAFFYDQGVRPVTAKCRLCGEKMPEPNVELHSPADIVFWLSQRFIEHKQQKHTVEAAE